MARRVIFEENDGLNMTPMIDIVFNLLIFFLLSTTYMNEEQEIELQLPTVAEAMPLTRGPDEIIVNILADGKIRVRSQEVDVDQLGKILEEAKKNYPDQAVAVRGDLNVRYEHVARAISSCKRAGITRLDVMVMEQ